MEIKIDTTNMCSHLQQKLFEGEYRAFIAQKDLPSGRKTLKAYYWKICGDQYDESLANG